MPKAWSLLSQRGIRRQCPHHKSSEQKYIVNSTYCLYDVYLFSPLSQNTFVCHGIRNLEVILQDFFQVWDPKHIFRKGRERHIFLFEMFLVFSKVYKDSTGKTKYMYKQKLDVSIIRQYLAV